MPPHITNLPLELLLGITCNVISKEDICRLRSVNSLFKTLATPEVFNGITVRNNKQSADKFWNMLLTPHIALHIRSISFVEEGPLAEKEVWSRLEGAFCILHQAPGLKTLEFRFRSYVKEYDYGHTIRVKCYSHQWDIVYALGSNRNPLPALQSLKIYGMVCCEGSLMSLCDEAPIAWLAASLRNLSFTTPSTTTMNELESQQFWKKVVVGRVLQPAVNLESLEITRCGNGPGFDISQAQLPVFPQLAALSLRNIIWDEDSGTGSQCDLVPLEFVMRHQKTLKKLELHDCSINIGRRYPPQCYWADIYKRLANTLTGLVELKVEFEPEENRIPYLSISFNYNYWHLKKDDLKGSALAQDPLALEEFRAVVKSQGMGGG